MPKLEMFEQAMCCETGICGPSFDKNLILIANVFEEFKKSDDVNAHRYNLAQQPQAFVENGTAIDLIHKKGKKILPITIVDGEVKKTGEYPSLEEFSTWSGLELAETEKDQLQN